MACVEQAYHPQPWFLINSFPIKKKKSVIRAKVYIFNHDLMFNTQSEGAKIPNAAPSRGGITLS